MTFVCDSYAHTLSFITLHLLGAVDNPPAAPCRFLSLSAAPLSLLPLHSAFATMGGGHHHVTPGSEPRKDQDLQAIKDARIPLAWRDTCSHILVDLNKCRRDTWWNPNKCEHERHIYEECEYNAYLQRVEAKVQEDKVRKSM